MKNKAVVLGANYYIGLSIIRCLGRQGIHVAAVDYDTKGTYGFKSRYLSERLIGPDCKEDPEGLLNFLIEYAKNQELAPVLYPSADGYAEFIDKYLPILRKYYLINQTEQGLFTRVLDKGKLYDMAEEFGMAYPETLSTEDENLEARVESEIKFPCLVKPTDSPSFVAHFRKKLFKVYNMEELKDAIRQSKEANLEVVVQRIIPGFDDHMYTFDAYLNQDAKVTHWTTCQKFRQFPINFGASVYTIQKNVPELYTIGKNFLEHICFKGFAEIEFKKDSETGKYYLIEINARTTNFNAMLNKIGLNMPYLAYQELTSSLPEPYAIIENTNTAFWYAYEDLLAIRGYLKTNQLKLGEILKTFNRPKAYALWDVKDPAPALSFLGMKIKRVFQKITGK